MAFNPIIASNGIPVTPEDGNEIFLLSRGGISFSVEARETGKFSGSGTLFLTSHSIFFVAQKITTQRGLQFISFRLPIANITEEKFNQPIFSANNLSGKCSPVVVGSTSDFSFKFKFNNGGCGTFLPIFFMSMERGRQNSQRFAQEVVNNGIANGAFVDPNDPTVIFVEQPTRAQVQPVL
jgi:WW domain-binding protein 2